jgi:integrase
MFFRAFSGRRWSSNSWRRTTSGAFVRRRKEPAANEPSRTFTPKQFDELVTSIPEPYGSMIYVRYTQGLRVSELAGLKWNDIIAIEQVNEV